MAAVAPMQTAAAASGRGSSRWASRWGAESKPRPAAAVTYAGPPVRRRASQWRPHSRQTGISGSCRTGLGLRLAASRMAEPGQRRSAGIVRAMDATDAEAEASRKRSSDAAREAAARSFVDLFVKDGMVVGTGSGSLSRLALAYLSKKLEDKAVKGVQLIPASATTAALAASFGLRLTTLEAHPRIDLAFGDVDELLDGHLVAIIGRGEVADRRESISAERALARAAAEYVALADSSDVVQYLSGAVPVLVNQEGWEETAEELDDIFVAMGDIWRRPSRGTADPMGGDSPLVSENSCFVLDIKFDVPIDPPQAIATCIEAVPGVVDHGILMDEVKVAVVAYDDGPVVKHPLLRGLDLPPLAQ